MTKGYTNTPPFEGAGGYAYWPGKTPTSVDDGIAGGADLIIDFPNGTILSTGGTSPAICTLQVLEEQRYQRVVVSLVTQHGK